MIYDVRQTTTCSYASPVAHAHHVLRLTPVHRDSQRVHLAALQIIPEPMHRREGQDFFGNRLTWIEIEEPHETLTVKLAARVAVDAPIEPAPASTPPWEAVREEAFAASDMGPLSPAHFLFPSRLVSLDPEIRDYTRESFTPGRPILEAAIELIGRLKADIVYEIGATTVTTTPPMSFALRRGVCQDFAHIMISGLRGHRPARRLCQRLPAQRARQGRDRGCRAARRCTPGCCYGAARRSGGSGSIRPTQYWRARITSCWRSGATTRTWRRSTA